MQGASELEILRPGRNCWRTAQVTRAAFLVDAESYFAALEEALRQARRSIWILGWDFDASIRLRVADDGSAGQRLGELLRSLVEERPDLRVRILIWNLSTLHAPGATMPLLFGAEWEDHPRIAMKLDSRHPVYGAQHQKVVCIDDSIAFIGGIDLTLNRWDTPEHLPRDPRRVTPEGEAYGAVHDVHLAIAGEAASCAARLAEDRWRYATGEDVAPSGERHDIWPSRLAPDFRNAQGGLARTVPRRGLRRGVREIEALNLDALSAAQDAIYIETQYFADQRIAGLLARLLQREHGPEVVVVLPREAHGVMERWIMDGNRERVIRRIKTADRFNRFRAVHPVTVSEDGDSDIFVHAKLIIVDDRLLRVGSSNLNRRSSGLDTECDFALEGTDAEARGAIAEIRARLLAEHLGAAPEDVREHLAGTGSLLGTVDRFNRNHRRLRDYAGSGRDGPTRLMLGTRLLDPRGPLRLGALLEPRRKAHL